ncbi:MAG: hypothetical protein C0619_14495 [Desulfuromonas sp.]|nr:MAG: hypothetical protein C0619_14495 [Desulfuromonas sp.]
MDMAKFKSMFLSEAGEHLKNMSAQLVTIEGASDDRDRINSLFRGAHSIKGMAASMGYEKMAELAHHLEDSLDHFRQGKPISPTDVDRLLDGVDLLEGLLEDISQDLPEREIADFTTRPVDQKQSVEDQPPAAAANPVTHYLQLILHDNVVSPAARLLLFSKSLERLGTIDRLVPSLEQIMNGQEHRSLQLSLQSDLTAAEIEQAFQDYPEISQLSISSEPPAEERRKDDRRSGDRRQGDRRAQSLTAGTVRVDTNLLDQFINLTGELVTNRHILQTALAEQRWNELNDGLGQLGKLVKNLHGQVVKVRMMPVSSITERLYRVVRDLSRKAGKEVALKVEGAEIELDRAILEEVADPLMHMVRNAVDHGIEQQGTVQVRIRRQRSHVHILIKDDGRGIDPRKLRERALEKGLISPKQAETMSDMNALQLICLPGFSTTTEVTETSGRGVGMDVVKAAVEKLDGILQIDSALGEGSRITMKLPLSVAIIRILLIRCNDRLMALPLSRIQQTHQIEREEIQSRGRQLLIQLKEEKIPLISLRKSLHMPVPPATNRVSLVVMELFGRKVGVVVDQIVGHQEVFVKKMPAPFDRLPGTNGGAVLGDGQVVFILDVQGFLGGRR